MEKTAWKIVIILLILGGIIGVLYIFGRNQNITKFTRFTPYRAIPEEVDISNMPSLVTYDREFEKPGDMEINKLLIEALNMAEKEENRIRHIVDRRLVRINYWNGMYSGSVIVEKEKTIYHFIFKSAKLEFQQFDKFVYKDKELRLRDNNKGISIGFYDDKDCIRTFNYGKEISLSFYPGNKLEDCGLLIDDKKYHRIQWDENGKLVSEHERVLNKNDE